MSLWKIIEGFLADALNSAAKDFLKPLENFLGDLLYATYFVEDLPGLDETILNTAVIDRALFALYGIATMLVAAKLIWKGTKVYILWRDGESETDPGEMLLGTVFAIIAAVAFPLLYTFAVEIVQEVVNAVCGAFFGGDVIVIDGLLDALGKVLTGGIRLVLFGLIFAILLLWLMFSMVKQGVEMLIFRLGIPFAASGLVDSDGGYWKPYIQQLTRELTTAAIRYFCLRMALGLAVSMTLAGLVVGIGFLVVAIKTPAMLAQFLAPKSGGGGAAQKLNTVVMAVRMFGGM